MIHIFLSMISFSSRISLSPISAVGTIVILSFSLLYNFQLKVIKIAEIIIRKTIFSCLERLNIIDSPLLNCFHYFLTTISFTYPFPFLENTLWLLQQCTVNRLHKLHYPFQ